MTQTSAYVERPSFLLLIALVIINSVSLKLSVDLFQSIPQNDEYSHVYAGIAVSFELLKLIVLKEAVCRYRHFKGHSFLFFGALYVLLSAISVMGSVGSLSKDTVSAVSQHESAKAKLEQKKQLFDARMKLVSQENAAIDYYQGVEYFKVEAAPLKQANEERLDKLESQIIEVELGSDTEYSAVSATIQNFFPALNRLDIEYLLNVVVSVVIELGVGVCSYLYFTPLTSTSISAQKSFRRPSFRQRLTHIRNFFSADALINGEEEEQSDLGQGQEFDPKLKQNRAVVAQESAQNKASNIQVTPVYGEKKYQFVVQELRNGTVKCSKRAVMDRFNIGSIGIKKYFEKLVADQVIEQDSKTKRYRVIQLASVL